MKNTKYIWLENPDNFKDTQKYIHQELVEDQSLQTVKAWTLKEDFKKFFKMQTVQQATDFFDKWVKRIELIDNKPLLKVVKTFENHLEGLLTYIKHRVSNAMAESINTSIQQIKANGYV